MGYICNFIEIIMMCSYLTFFFPLIFSEDGFSRNVYKSSKSIESDSIIFSESAEITNNVNWVVENYSQSSSHYSYESDSHNDNEDLSFSSFVSIFCLLSVVYF